MNLKRLLLSACLLGLIPAVQAQINVVNNTTCDHQIVITEYNAAGTVIGTHSFALPAGETYEGETDAVNLEMTGAETSPGSQGWTFPYTSSCCRPNNPIVDQKVSNIGTCNATITYSGEGNYSFD